MPFHSEQLTELNDFLARVTPILALTHDDLDPDLAMQGIKTEFPGWSALCSLQATSVPENVLEYLGGEIAHCAVSGGNLRESSIKILKSAAKHLKTSFVLPEEIHTKLQRKTFEAIRKHRPKGWTADENLERQHFSGYYRNHIFSEINFARSEDRKATQNLAMQTPSDFFASTRLLRRDVEQGDMAALFLCLDLLVGVPPGMSRKVPILLPEISDWVIVIDVVAGIIKTDFSTIIARAKAPLAGCIPSNFIACRPLPIFLAEALRQAYMNNSRAQTLGDLDSEQHLFANKNRTHHYNPHSNIIPSRSRLIAARGAIALQAGVNRAAAAHIVADFQLIGNAQNHYIVISREEISLGAAKFYDHIGWGAPVPLEAGPATGSVIMPERQTIMRRHANLAAQVSDTHPGKKYSILGLATYHANYANLCGATLELMTAARATNVLRFTAATFPSGASYTSILDKKVGLLDGHSPVPISPFLAEQVRLWLAHCRCLDQRLARKNWLTTHPVRQHIQRIFTGEAVPLLFHFQEQQLEFIGSHHIEQTLPPELRHKGDGARHFWENTLRVAGLSSPDINRFMRHETIGLENFSSTSDGTLADAFARITSVQQKTLLELGIFPVIGLAKR
ncbi:hypothetical protein D3878_14500 [Noviherbaspirillum sedimenti]|uniref:Uncharacterized protein n=1 Tax=Noviherbaspirillum sedimenti TaxID=2320865 RepID=A0A3A3G4P4_9BURK|nr:hypothetical protein D3878_14500 [Noviherbaspirillum sedimenti]